MYFELLILFIDLYVECLVNVELYIRVICYLKTSRLEGEVATYHNAGC